MPDTFNPFEDARPGAADANLARELWQVTRAANRANATIYTFAARGIVGGSDQGANVDPLQWSDYLRKTMQTLRVLAEETGGIAVVSQDDVDKALSKIGAESGDDVRLGILR